MKNEINISSINKISFSSTNQEIQLEAIICKDNLCYESTFMISSTDLNKILNKLFYLNPEIDVNSLIESDNFINNEILYTLNCIKYPELETNISHFEFKQQLRQIRA